MRYRSAPVVEELAAFGPTRLNTWIVYFPFEWMITVNVPAALFGHRLILRRLRAGQILKLEPSVRRAAQTVGGLLIYLPAGLKMTLQLGAAQNGAYAVGFGAIWLVGVLTGMLFRVRAYVLLGVGFLILDVVANLVHMSRRDHRIGFWILSLAGLAILSIMVLTTTRRKEMQRLVRSVRSRFDRFE